MPRRPEPSDYYVGPPMTKRQPARPHRHSWQAVAVGADGRILEGCTVDRCVVTRVSDQRQVGLWDPGINAQTGPTEPNKSAELADE